MKLLKTMSIVLAGVCLVMALASCGKTDNGEALVDETVIGGADGPTDIQIQEQEKVTPTFMFFSSESDENYQQTMEAVNELKETYGEKVKFDLVDIDQTPEATENFPVKDQTPALIMLNTSNDICAFEFKITDKSKMEEAIKKALE